MSYGADFANQQLDPPRAGLFNLKFIDYIHLIYIQPYMLLWKQLAATAMLQRGVGILVQPFYVAFYVGAELTFICRFKYSAVGDLLLHACKKA